MLIPKTASRVLCTCFTSAMAGVALLAVTACSPQPTTQSPAQPAPSHADQVPSAAHADGGHDAHAAQPTHAAALPPDGQRWATDAPLRKAMGTINTALGQSLAAIHEDRLSEAQYVQLAELVRGQVAYMVEHCQLPSEADAQLHLIIARLLAGADGMAATGPAQRQGAITLVGALNDYPHFFADSEFTPLKH